MKDFSNVSVPQAVILSLMGNNDADDTRTSLKMLGIDETNLTTVSTTDRNEWLIENGFSKVNDNLFFKEDSDHDFTFALVNEAIFTNTFFKVAKVITKTGAVVFPSEFNRLLEEAEIPKDKEQIRHLLHFINYVATGHQTLNLFGWTFKSLMFGIGLEASSAWYNRKTFNFQLKSAWLHCRVITHMSSWRCDEHYIIDIVTVSKDSDIQVPDYETITTLDDLINTCIKLKLLDTDNDIDMSDLTSWKELEDKLRDLIQTAIKSTESRIKSVERRALKVPDTEKDLKSSIKPIAVIKEPDNNKEMHKHQESDSLYNKIALFAIFIAALILVHNCKG